MSESFSNLWVSSSPAKNQQALPKTLAAAKVQASNGVSNRNPPDAFSMLASSAGSSQPSSRPITPVSIRHQPATSKPNFNAAIDAFGDLVSFGSSTSRDDTLTIAEQAAKAERERKARSEKESAALQSQGSFWDQYETSANKSAATQSTQPIHAWDLDFLTSTDTPHVSSKPPSKAADFGDLEDGFLGGNPSQEEEEEDEILGSLAKPVEEIRNVFSKSSHTMLLAQPKRQDISRVLTTSPPPHVLGRIVEMGFSVEQARAALMTTSTGLDVDAAIEFLLRDSRSSSPRHKGITVAPQTEAERGSKHRQGPGTTLFPDDSHSQASSIHSESSSAYQQGLQEQADKLLAQASSIGLNMFNKANTFWKEGREKMVKAYEEQRIANVTTGKDKPDSKAVYRSPARRRPIVTASASNAMSSPSTTQSSSPLITRMIVDASPSAQAASNANKKTGNEHFKLGRFPEAEAAYSRAIDALPTSHLQRIPLHNNRALTRLKTGEYMGTIEDATEVIRIVTGDAGTAWHPGRETASVGQNLGDALIKALRRRAEAYEGLEKWNQATTDWERLSTTAWASQTVKIEAIKIAARCRKMASGVTPLASFQHKPETKIKPARVYPVTHSSNEAVSRVRAANLAQEKEEQARHDLKDIVDTRLSTWRTGKETNLRALIASLDMVLSPTFGWQKVSMAELVSPGQVKVRYTKAIAKLHPDKLNMDNTTLEERMMANAIFGTLNEAWNAFR